MMATMSDTFSHPDKSLRRIRSTKAQINYLCHYMHQHPEFAAGEFRSALGAAGMQRQWETLAAALGELGPQRTVDQWKTCWRDQKRKARAEGGALSSARNATGNSVPMPELSGNAALILETIGPEMAMGFGPESEIGASGPIAALSPQHMELGGGQHELMSSAAGQLEIGVTPGAQHSSPSVAPSVAPSPLVPPVPRTRAVSGHSSTPRAGTLRTPIRGVSGGRRRVRPAHPHESFLGAQLEFNNLLRDLTDVLRSGQQEVANTIRELTSEVRRSNEVLLEHLVNLPFQLDGANGA